MMLPVRPRLRADVRSGAAGEAELHTSGGVLDVAPPDGMTGPALLDLLQRLDGTSTLTELAAVTGLSPALLAEVVAPAVAWGLVDDGAPPEAHSALSVLSRLEDVFNRLLEELVFDGPLWTAVLHEPETLPPSVFYGFGLENWFFLSKVTEIGSAVLAHAENAAVRRLLNDFFHEEHHHDDIVMRAFEPLGITERDLLRARPLPTTAGLIKSLSWWSRTDPLFFVATLGVLEGRLSAEVTSPDGRIAYDSFLVSCDRVGLPAGFVEPLREHAMVNSDQDHPSINRDLFAQVPGIDAATQSRWLGKAHLFMEVYATFCNGILGYYRDPGRPLLRTCDLGGAAP